MVPAFRFLAYYFIANQGRQEIVADSVWVDVMDVCEGKVNSKQVASDFVFQNNNTNNGIMLTYYLKNKYTLILIFLLNPLCFFFNPVKQLKMSAFLNILFLYPQ